MDKKMKEYKIGLHSKSPKDKIDFIKFYSNGPNEASSRKLPFYVKLSIKYLFKDIFRPRFKI
jgi:hypothetical protein